jgi:hypothetical protein
MVVNHIPLGLGLERHLGCFGLFFGVADFGRDGMLVQEIHVRNVQQIVGHKLVIGFDVEAEILGPLMVFLGPGKMRNSTVVGLRLIAPPKPDEAPALDNGEGADTHASRNFVLAQNVGAGA